MDMDKEVKKEAFRKYLEGSGVLDALTKVLVSLYEESDKPSSATEFILERLGGATMGDYQKLLAEKLDLENKYAELLKAHEATCKEVEELKNQPELSAADKQRGTW